MAAERTAVPFLDTLRASGLLSDAQLAELSKCPEARDPAPTPLARIVLEPGWLTRFQLNMIATGSAKGLTVGPYLVLDRIGEGGMGTVYKARHQHMQRLVALKVIRKERLATPNALNRFIREVQLAGTLHHPNIVMAYDAGTTAGNTHYFAMEYVDGIDLARLVKEQGPLPVAQACDYIRQAALGLQHAQKKGLVHRDVKPSNLLVSRDAATESDVVKLLDMGLARATGSGDMGLTKIGAVIGTPDYLAPEQAMNSKAADIRADLYSLGCSLFYLLTGKPPFIASELTEMLLKHQMEKPVPLAEQGVAAPKKVQTILDRLMAKQPDDRYQTPAELIDDLEPFCRATTDAGHVKAAKDQPTDDWATMAKDDTAEKESPDRSTAGVRPSRRKQVAADQTRHKKRLLLFGIGGAALLVLGVVLFLALRSDKPDAVAQGPKASEPVKDRPTEKSETGGSRQSTDKVSKPHTAPDDVANPPVDPPKVVSGTFLALPPKEPVNAAAFSKDGRQVVIGGQKLRLWDVAGNKEIHDFGKAQYVEVRAIAWSADGRQVLVGGAVLRDGKKQGEATLYEVDSGKVVKTFIGHPTSIYAVALSADGRRILTAAGETRLQDGKIVVDDIGIRLWDATTGKELGTYFGPTNPTRSLAFAPDGKSFFAGGTVIDGAIQRSAVYTWEVESKNMRCFPLAGGFGGGVILSPDGGEVVYMGNDWAYHFANSKDGSETRRSERLSRPTMGGVWSRGGRYFAFTSGKLAGTPDTFSSISLMDAASGKVVQTFEGDANVTMTLAISDDGRLILSYSTAGTRLWVRDQP